MAETATKVPVQSDKPAPAPTAAPDVFRPFEALRRQVDRIFEDFDRNPWRLPFARSLFDAEPFTARGVFGAALPAVDVAEHEKQYEITAELPGLSEGDIEVSLANQVLTIKGEKKEEKEDEQKDYHVSERRYGSFRRSFQVPEGVDTGKIEASFKNGVLTLVLPKSAEAQQQEKKIEIKAA
jgi:HSP20 family protein